MHHEILRPEALALARVLGGASELNGFTLIGGTALAMQIGHRISLDFDFACFTGRLPTNTLDTLVSRLKASGNHRVQLLTSPEQISAFRINTGNNLLDLVRDYVIDGIKVSFFAHGKTDEQRAFYADAVKVKDQELGLTLLALPGLKVAKTLVLADRVRSRDLHDLYILMRDHGYTMNDLFTVVRRLGTVDDPEYYKAVMRGEIPLDADDEGLQAVDVSQDINAVYAFFRERLDDWERRRAADFFRDGE